MHIKTKANHIVKMWASIASHSLDTCLIQVIVYQLILVNWDWEVLDHPTYSSRSSNWGLIIRKIICAIVC